MTLIFVFKSHFVQQCDISGILTGKTRPLTCRISRFQGTSGIEFNSQGECSIPGYFEITCWYFPNSVPAVHACGRVGREPRVAGVRGGGGGEAHLLRRGRGRVPLQRHRPVHRRSLKRRTLSLIVRDEHFPCLITLFSEIGRLCSVKS